MNSKILKQLKQEIRLILLGQPGLTCNFSNKTPVSITGNYEIRDDTNHVQDVYEVKVIIPSDYPYAFPVLFETSNKIERIIDRHISKEGMACVEIDRKIKIIAAHGITLNDFFKNYVHKYFCWQILYDTGERSQLYEWSHNEEGAVQFYSEYLKLPLNIVRDCIKLIIENKLPARNANCPCGSGKKLKACHESIFNDLKVIGKIQLYKDLQLLQTYNTAA